MPSYYGTTAAGTSITTEGWLPASGYYYDMQTPGYYFDEGWIPKTRYYYGYQYTGNAGQTISDVKPKPAPRPEPEPCTEEELLEFLKS